MINLAYVANEPTPYRLHLLERVADELDGVRLHSIFTHTVDMPTMPWAERPSEKINPVFFEGSELGRGSRNPRRARRLFREIRSYLVDNDVEMVILHGYDDLTRLMLTRWCKKAGIPCLVRGDSNVFKEGRGGTLKHLAKRAFLRHLLTRIDGLMVMGTCGRAFYRAHCDHDLPTFLAPVEPDYAALRACDEMDRKEFLADHRMAPERRRLMYSGRLVDIKNVDRLIDAFCEIAERRPDWDLVIAGDGPLREALRGRIPTHLQERIQFLGFLQFDGMRACYHASDVLVLPSETEPWSLAINEALACGLAVVTTDVVGAGVELVRHNVNGLIVPVRQTEALADALLEVTQSARCAEMRENSTRVLEEWRIAADPIDGFKAALRHFGLLSAPQRHADVVELEPLRATRRLRAESVPARRAASA